MEVAKWLVYYGIELSRTREIQEEKRAKLKEELRRRMTAVRAARSNTQGSSNGLGPRPVGARTYTTKAKDAELAQPLLTSTSH